MKKVRIGVLGAYRGTSMINYCKRADHAEVVAICDKNPEALDAQRAAADGLDIAFYDNFEDFIKHDMDAVVLANYANEHAPFAIKCLKAGKHVYSEKPLAADLEEGKALLALAKEKGLMLGGAPDTFLGAGIQTCRKLIDEGAIGEVVGATAFMTCHGHESWHRSERLAHEVCVKSGDDNSDASVCESLHDVHEGVVKELSFIDSDNLDIA